MLEEQNVGPTFSIKTDSSSSVEGHSHAPVFETLGK